MMKILFLGNNVAKNLSDWLKSKGENVIYTEDAIDLNIVKQCKPDFIISYNYHYIVPKQVIDYISGRAINLHISFLPWNRGTYPNVWSFIYDTPKGVSIAWMINEVDAGDIIAQKQIELNKDKETLRSSYEKLHKEIQELFKDHWDKIRNGNADFSPQKGDGSMFFDRDFEDYIKPLLGVSGWDIPVSEFLTRYQASHDKSRCT